jgi:hypothetical protein
MSITISRSWLRLKGLVERLQQLGGARVVGADDDAVGLHEVLDRRALLEELRVGDHVELDRAPRVFKRPRNLRLHLVGGADRHRRLVDDDAVLGHVLADVERATAST